MATARIGAVSYLNTRPLVHGLVEGLGRDRIELSFDTPAVLADRLRAEQLDMALLPVIELARIDGLQIVPGLGITTRGPSRSVLLIGKTPPKKIETLALDPESRTTNALVQVLLARVWKCRPTIVEGGLSLEENLERADAAVRIGDKALFEPLPEDAEVRDLATVWTEATGLPFVFAVWATRPGVVDRELYKLLHESRRRGVRAVGQIAGTVEWQGQPRHELAREYLERHIHFRLGSQEMKALRIFLREAAGLGLIERVPPLPFALGSDSACHEAAKQSHAIIRALD